MAWVARNTAIGKDRRFVRAILSKYCKKVSPGVYLGSTKSVLDAVQAEIGWCIRSGLPISVEIISENDEDFVF